MHNLGETRSARRPDHLLLTPDTFVRAPLPGMKKCMAMVHVGPAIGAAFTQYTAEFEPGGVLGSEAHPRGSIECLSVLDGELVVEVGDFGQTARAGETLRYRCDRPHRIRNLSSAPAHATMVCILKAAAME